MTFQKLAGALLLTATFCLTASAGAVTIYDDKTAFNTDAPATLALETFNSNHGLYSMTQIGTPAGATQQAVNSTNSNAAFNAGDIAPGINFWLTADNTNGLIGWYVVNQDGDSYMMTANYGLRITFDAPVTWFGMDVLDSQSAGDIILKSGTDEVTSFTYGGPGFVGFNSAIGITSLEFTNTWVDFDNVTFSAADAPAETPEPGTFVLGGAGMAAAWVIRRRRSA